METSSIVLSILKNFIKLLERNMYLKATSRNLSLQIKCKKMKCKVYLKTQQANNLTKLSNLQIFQNRTIYH